MPHRTFEIDEVAKYLNMVQAEVERLVKGREIPFERHGNRVVFRKMEIDSWASPRLLGMESRRLEVYYHQAAETARGAFPAQALVSELLRAGAIEPALSARTKASVIREMARLGARTGRVCDVAELVEQLSAREADGSTGLPGGLAVLHPRHPEDWLFESPFIAFARTVQDVPFGAPDGKFTNLFFLIACPDSSTHLHVLARICLLAQRTSMLQNLRASFTAEEMAEQIAAAEGEALSNSVTRF